MSANNNVSSSEESGLLDNVCAGMSKAVISSHIEPNGNNSLANKTLLAGEGGEDELEENENYVIVDIGANLTNKKFTRDLDSVISRAQDAGV